MGKKNRAMLAEESIKRYQSLLVQGYFSKEQFQQKQVDLLDQYYRLQSLERDRIGVKRE